MTVTTIDDFVRAHNLKRVGFVKIDTEGHEWPVLRGAQETISRDRPVVYLEFNSWCLSPLVKAILSPF